MNKVAFGRRLYKVRKEQNITSESLAQMCDFNPTFIRHIESAVHIPSLPVLVTICNKLHISPNYLLTDSLESNEQEQINNILKKLMLLTPNQIDMIDAMIETILSKSEE